MGKKGKGMRKWGLKARYRNESIKRIAGDHKSLLKPWLSKLWKTRQMSQSFVVYGTVSSPRTKT